MTEEQFIDRFIAAVFRCDQNQMRRLCHRAVQDLGQESADAALSQACAAIELADFETGQWVDSWFEMGCCN